MGGLRVDGRERRLTRRRGVCQVSWRGSASGSARRSCGSQSGNESGSATRCGSSRTACWAKGGGRKVGRRNLVRGSSWMVGNRRGSKGGSQRVGPEGSPPTDRGSDSHGPRPTPALRGRAETRGAGCWSQTTASGRRGHRRPRREAEGPQPYSLCCRLLSPGPPGYKGLARGDQSAY